MTKEEIIELAGDNGYDISGKTDEQLLLDYAFHKAAFSGFETEIIASFGCPTHAQAQAVGMAAHRARFLRATAMLEGGGSVEDAWSEVSQGAKTVTAHEADEVARVSMVSNFIEG